MPVLTKINTNVIADDAVTGDKFAGDAYLANTATENITGTYSENRLYTSDAYTLSGNTTINSHLTLSTIKSTGDVVLTAGGAYTITGTGVLAAGSVVASTPVPDLTGKTGWEGMIAPFAMISPPNGWLICDGSAVSRTTYANLFSAISTTWGAGNGSSTFNVPDLRGAFLRGTGPHGSSNMADGNDFAGPAVGAFENDQFQKHQHTIRGDTGGSGNNVISWNAADKSGVSATLDQILSGTGYGEHDSGGTPRVGDETRPFNAGIQYCIKT